jgi:uncharacterized membrane protein
MELQTALDQISEIHRQMARTRIFRGYRAATCLTTGIIAFAASAYQAYAVPNPAAYPEAFVDLWVSVAITCLVIVSAEIVLWYRRSDSSLQRELTLLAIEQFLPCIVVGGLVTLVIHDFAESALWMLPGLWSIFFGLGTFASRRLLPWPVVFVGAFYLLAGLCALATARHGAMFSPWAMAIPFGLGQTALAAILHFTLERKNV